MLGGDYDGQLNQLHIEKGDARQPTSRDPIEREHRQPRSSSSRAGWIYVIVSICVIVPIFLATVLTIGRVNSRVSHTGYSPSALAESLHEIPMAPVRYVEPLLGGPGVELRTDFDERNGWPSEGRILSQAGYPVMVVFKEAPACDSPYRVKEALDAVKSGDHRWLEAMPSCELIGTDVVAEWISNPYKGLDTVAMRLTLSDGSRKTLYAPSNNPDVGIEAWFGHRYRQ